MAYVFHFCFGALMRARRIHGGVVTLATVQYAIVVFETCVCGWLPFLFCGSQSRGVELQLMCTGVSASSSHF